MGGSDEPRDDNPRGDYHGCERKRLHAFHRIHESLFRMKAKCFGSLCENVRDELLLSGLTGPRIACHEVGFEIRCFWIHTALQVEQFHLSELNGVAFALQ